MGPIVGAVIAELLTTGATNLPIHPFRIERFKRAQNRLSVDNTPRALAKFDARDYMLKTT